MWLCASALWARRERASAEIRCIQSQTEPPRGEKIPKADTRVVHAPIALFAGDFNCFALARRRRG